MVRVAQTGILGIVILTAILLVIVSVTFLWGQPLIQKNVDRANINLIMDKMDEINDAVLYTASTGSNSIVDLDLSASSFVVDTDNNRVVYETYSTVPIIASTQEVPVNYYELAEERETITYNTSSTYNVDPQVTGYELITHHGNTTIDSVFYNVTVHENTGTNEWELVCFWKDYTIKEAADCAMIGEAVTKQGVSIDVIGIITAGEGVYALGDYVENFGVLGSEPSGIISAQSLSLRDKEKVTFYLTYRTMISSYDEEYKIIIDCADNCVASNVDKKLLISRTNVVMSSDQVTTYINLEVQ
ncbi:MAG: hypothetical protein JW791_02285 [Nanoarchaeota archaeon]|nr:hypothetical protein [Nanoarchaeota archaeon]